MFKRLIKATLPLSRELLKDLQENSRTFLKLDLAYFAAAGTAITLFKLDANSLIENIEILRFIPFALVALIFFDVTLDSVVLGYRIADDLPQSSKQRYSVDRFCIELQPFLHGAFITAVIIGGTLYADAVGSTRRFFSTVGQLQDSLATYIDIKGKSPDSFDILVSEKPYTKIFLARINQPFVYEKIGRRGFILTFAGSDNKIGTNDDVVLTHRSFPMSELFGRSTAKSENSKDSRIKRIVQADLEAKFDLQDALDQYIEIKGKSPVSFDEFVSERPEIKELISDIDEELIYKKDGSKGYSLQFSIRNAATSVHDLEATHLFNLRKAQESIKRREQNNANDATKEKKNK